MANNEVLLVKPVEGLGGEGDQVRVRAGYARNYLLPRGIAVPLTGANRKQVESLKKRRSEREAHELNGAQDLAKRIEKASLAFAVKTGEGGKMFGAITSADIHEKLTAAGVEVDKRRIHLHTPVKTLGKHTVKIRLHADVVVELGFDVVSENPIVAPVVVEAPKQEYRMPREYREPREKREPRERSGKKK